MALLEVRGLKKNFTGKNETLHAVKGIDFTIEEGECLGLVGESGCGKSTTANMTARLLKESEGDIFFLGKRINGGKRLCAAGKEMQMVFQNPADSFNPHYSVLECVMKGARYYKLYSKSELKERAMEWIKYVGLKESYLEKKIGELSGGECQRTAIARALICNPALIICDEATSALDVSVQAQVVELIRKLKEEKKVSFLFITHDLALTSSVCDRIAVMYSGRIVEMGETKAILQHPMHPYTQLLLSCVLPAVGDDEYRVPECSSFRGAGDGCDFYEFCPKICTQCKDRVPDLQEREGRMTACFQRGDPDE